MIPTLLQYHPLTIAIHNKYPLCIVLAGLFAKQTGSDIGQVIVHATLFIFPLVTKGPGPVDKIRVLYLLCYSSNSI